jgi:hypothetical protein
LPTSVRTAAASAIRTDKPFPCGSIAVKRGVSVGARPLPRRRRRRYDDADGRALMDVGVLFDPGLFLQVNIAERIRALLRVGLQITGYEPHRPFALRDGRFPRPPPCTTCDVL